MTRLFPRGSEWRKWDLHLHPPGTKLSDGYGKDDWDHFCAALEQSDVHAFGITDYFSFDGYRRTRDSFAERYPDTGKLLLPNLEMRLNEHVNRAADLVDIHLIFRPEAPDELLDRFLAALPTQLTDGRGRSVMCAELDGVQFDQATVSRADLNDALRAVFGPGWGADDVLIIVPASNSGIRAESGVQRKASIADEMDKFVDAIFGGSQNVEWYLRADRFEDQGQVSSPKPVFACSDAHSLEQLTARLGRSVDSAGDHREVTWIKADLTYEGLMQTLIEPAERVRIQASQPDLKEPYKTITSVRFSGSDDFPSNPIELNPNLVSVIGSRSSGKSALLAYISHAVDPTYTVRQQVDSGITTEQNAGPAAGLTWADVGHIECEVTWGLGVSGTGRVVYIPQNSLFTVSERPREISAKVLPALYRLDPDFQVAHERMQLETESANAEIRRAVDRWFTLEDQIANVRSELRDLGDEAAVRQASDDLAEEIRLRREASELTADEVTTYQAVMDAIGGLESEAAHLQAEKLALDSVVHANADGTYTASDDVDVTISRLPAATRFPSALEGEVADLVSSAAVSLRVAIRERVVAYRATLEGRQDAVELAARESRSQHSELIAKNQANGEVEGLVRRKREQDEHLRRIGEHKGLEATLVAEQADQVAALVHQISQRQAATDTLIAAFQQEERRLDDMAFGVEREISAERLGAVSAAYNRQENTEYFDRSAGEQIRLQVVLDDPGAFMRAVASGTQKLRLGASRSSAVTDVLTVTPDVEFFAQMEGDRIGGFQPSSMTPGKQALFALTLIINESEDAWPLLLDQPEDDLDSRSIYGSIVPFLTKRKRDRQILMVSHDANLVVGADSEQIIVANRHGDDRRNRGDCTFGYLGGSLEWSSHFAEAPYVLEASGTREHACDILDGGEEAFQKRKLKYKI